MTGDETFGERIRRLREDKKTSDPRFSLRQFAEAVGVSPTFVSKMERGEFNPPSAETIKRMAASLGADPDELLALAGKVDPDLRDIISEKPAAMAEFLRTARKEGLTEEEIRKLTKQVRQRKKS